MESHDIMKKIKYLMTSILQKQSDLNDNKNIFWSTIFPIDVSHKVFQHSQNQDDVAQFLQSFGQASPSF